MLKWLLLGGIIYFLVKSARPILGLFRMNQTVKMKQKKADIRSKIQKMDILDAEYEETDE